MVKNYNLCNDELRRSLVVKIHVQNMSICKAAQELGIKYPTAKAINAVYLKENRIKKKQHYEPRKKTTLAKQCMKLQVDGSALPSNPSGVNMPLQVQLNSNQISYDQRSVPQVVQPAQMSFQFPYSPATNFNSTAASSFADI